MNNAGGKSTLDEREGSIGNLGSRVSVFLGNSRASVVGWGRWV